MSAPRGILVTGTDTGIGKTVVASALCAAMKSRGHDVRALKPVESGTNENDGVPADASLLAACAGMGSWQEANVVALAEPLAPVVAAELESASLDLEAMDARVAELRSQGPLVVEGVGGALVEVVPGTTVADLAGRWDLAVLVVAGNRLGVLNHTLLTIEALLSRGAVVAGVVINTLHPGDPTVAERTNAAELERLLDPQVRVLGRMPWVEPERLADPEALGTLAGWLPGRLLPFFG